MAPGALLNPDRRQRTEGVLAGIDWSQRSFNSLPQGVLVGVLTGYSHTRNRYTNAEGTTEVVDFGGERVFRILNSSGNEDTIEGPSVGGYASVFSGGLSGDLLFKADFFDFDRRGSITERVFLEAGGCTGNVFQQMLHLPSGTQSNVTSLDGSTTLHQYTLASNLQHKFDLGGGRWWEPTVGVRYTFSDFGDNASVLGLEDGHVFRVQGGIRVGASGAVGDGSFWTVALTGLLYSDVIIDGFVTSASSLPPTAVNADEGKLRALGLLQGKIEMPDGFSYYGQVEVRGGEDVIGAGGKAGIRYQW